MLVAILPLLFAMRQSALRQQQRGDHPCCRRVCCS
jgi:hypothetical protein